MTANEAMWSERVAAWRASGLTSEAFCEGREFTAGGLRHWAHRLERAPKARQSTKRRQHRAAAPSIRLARVVRPAGKQGELTEEGAPRLAREQMRDRAAGITLEVGRVRVAVEPGVDRETLEVVLAVLGGMP
jgi:hypothetical protein